MVNGHSRIGSEQATIDNNSVLIRMAIACLVRRAGGTLVITNAELNALRMERPDAGLAFSFDEQEQLVFRLIEGGPNAGVVG